MRNLIITTTIVIVLTLALGLTNAHAQVGDGILNDYPKEQGEFMETLNDIIQNVKNGNVDRLISFHAYTQDLLNFEGGALRNGGEENEEHERNYKWKKSNFYVLKLALNPPLSYKCFSIRTVLV